MVGNLFEMIAQEASECPSVENLEVNRMKTLKVWFVKQVLRCRQLDSQVLRI